MTHGGERRRAFARGRALWQIAAVAARDPKLRPYRAAAWIAYFGVIALLAVLVVGSIARNLWGRPRPVAATGAVPTRSALRLCLADLEALYREQNERAWALGAGFEAPDPLRAWADWARGWEERLEDLSDRCRLDVTDPGERWHAERTEMAAARDALLALHRVYNAQVNRFAEEHADLAHAAAESMAHARRAVAAAH